MQFHGQIGQRRVGRTRARFPLELSGDEIPQLFSRISVGKLGVHSASVDDPVSSSFGWECLVGRRVEGELQPAEEDFYLRARWAGAGFLD